MKSYVGSALLIFTCLISTISIAEGNLKSSKTIKITQGETIKLEDGKKVKFVGTGSRTSPPTPPKISMPASHLYFDRLDDANFPELQIGPGRKGINARLLHPPGDPRVPAPRDAITLLVAFLIEMQPPPPDRATPRPGWQLNFDGLDRAGKPVRHTIALEARPLAGDFVEHAPSNPDLPRPTGTPLYVGAYWVDVRGLFQSKLWRPGMVIELRHGPHAQTRLTLT